MSSKVSDYVLHSPHTYMSGKYDTKTMPAGTFLRPIEVRYVPKHVLDDPRWPGFNKVTEVFCYCSYGIIPVPRNLLREI